MTSIPYVIMEAEPDWKRPSILHHFGSVAEDEVNTFLLARLCDFILERIDIDQLTCEVDIDRFFETYYDECYMDNPPWDVKVFRGGEWMSAYPTHAAVWEHIQLVKHAEEQEEEQDEDGEQEQEETQCATMLGSTDGDYSKEEIDACLETMLKDQPVCRELVDSMTIHQRMVFIFQKMSLFTPDEFVKYKDLVIRCINTVLPHLKEAIDLMTSKLTVQYTEDDDENLKSLIQRYTNIMELKTQYRF
ncbi:MAG: hypothetical protein ACOVRN_13335 [Flavobacterium sp.]